MASRSRPLTYDPGSGRMADMSGAFGTPQNGQDPDRQDCLPTPAHNRWVQMASSLGSGIYRLNVNTSLEPTTRNVGAENLFSIWVQSSGNGARLRLRPDGGLHQPVGWPADVLLRPDRAASTRARRW